MPSFRIWSLRLQAGRDRVYGPLADRRTVLSFLKCQVVRDALLDFGADLLEVESAERVLVSPCLQAPLFAVGPVLLSNLLGPLALDCCTGLQYSWKIHDHNRRPGGGQCPEDRRSDVRGPPNPSPRRRRPQRPRLLTRAICLYIDPHTVPVDPDFRFAEAELQPRLLFEDAGLWATVRKLKAQIGSA